MSDGFEDDVFEGEFCEVVFGDVVEGDVLGCYGVAVFGSSPADAFWADCKPFCRMACWCSQEVLVSFAIR